MFFDEIIKEATARLARSAKPEKIFLFGSYARGDARERSDLDFMVVQREIKHRRKEMVRLQDALRTMRIPVDILVVSESTFVKWKDVVGTVFYEVNREGRLCYDSSEFS